MTARVPDRWRAYPCDEYFEDGWWLRGHYDEESYTLVIVPLEEAYENMEFEFFAVGRSGSDGIDFGFRKGALGLWAFHPIECEFQYMAPTVAQLVEGWCGGRLAV
jgi:hypothetical protein